MPVHHHLYDYPVLLRTHLLPLLDHQIPRQHLVLDPMTGRILRHHDRLGRHYHHHVHHRHDQLRGGDLSNHGERRFSHQLQFHQYSRNIDGDGGDPNDHFQLHPGEIPG